MKTIICIRGKANTGKTQTLLNFYKLLDPLEENILSRQDEDICATVIMKDILIGVETQGDPLSQQENWIKELIQKSCDIIVCASRTKGETIECVKKYASLNGYSLIWASPFVVKNEELHDLCHQLMAISIINLINQVAHV